MKALDEILHEYFGAGKNIFLKRPREVYDGTCEYFTVKGRGAQSYNKLVGLLYDLGKLGVIENADGAVDILDAIVRDEI